ncbi:helix-turn-helix domain-containing protein [Cohnella hashimotonis]|uniref:AraC family transcriptional regulator n=1 Tax=Cohnella hashimotonis TaxID=2826895 RepID=A0ABT6TG80_9BACL|nr:AraC family transcriptional regulator [Cohnella hashimotonis]MDI4645838.1 AraC family transcriptional regulator [Cohnella hashimotonis]
MNAFINAVELAQPVVHFANRWVGAPGEAFGPRIIGDYQWIYVRGGKGSARIGTESFRVYAGCLFTYGPGQPHWFRSSDDDPLVLYGLHFGYEGHAGLDDVLRMIQNVDWDRFEKISPDVPVPFPSKIETGAWPLPYFERLVEEYRGNRTLSALVLRGLITELLARVARWVIDKPPPALPQDKRMLRVKESLESNAMESYQTDWLTDGLPFSQDYVSRLFKHCFGHSPRDFHNQARLAKARQLLEETELSSTAIADRMKFGSVHHFCKWFKKHTGIQPGAYRKRSRFL